MTVNVPSLFSNLRSTVPTLRAAVLLCTLSLLAGRVTLGGEAAVAAKPVPRPPVFFVANEGQRTDETHFYASGVDIEAAFDSTGVTFSRAWRQADSSPNPDARVSRRGLVFDSGSGRPLPVAPVSTETVHLKFVGARPNVSPEGLDPLPTTLNYFHGPQDEWITGVPTYGRVIYSDLWDGIDLEYVGDAGALKYNFIVHPGADPSLIRLAWHDTQGVRITGEGALEIAMRSGNLEDGRPVAFQSADVGRATIPADFSLDDNSSHAADGAHVVGFEVGPYDDARDLIIDPAYPVYAGFFGTSAYDRALGIAVHEDGHAYITGETTDPDTEDTDAYVAKIALDGSGYDYISFIGGDWYDGAYDIVVDDAGHAYITGPTMSDESSFPLVMGPDLTFNGVMDVLVAKLAPDGEDLIYAGYLGGELTEFGEGIRVDGEGAVYLHGIVLSTEATFPVKVGPDLTFNGESDAFVAKIAAVPDAENVEDNIIYSGYIGGDRSDITLMQSGTWSILSSGHIGLDTDGALYVSGQTTSAEDTFPNGDGFGSLPGADQTWSAGWDAFVAKVVPDGSQLAYATYVGGEGADTGKGMVIDADGHAYFTGYTDSTEATLPVTVGPDLTHNGDLDGIVGKLAVDGSAFEFLGYFGGDDTDAVDSITLDADGKVLIVGYTESLPGSFPAKNGPDDTQNDLEDGAGDAFVARLVADPSASDLIDNVDFAGYIGGAAYDQAFWVGLDGDGGIYVVGDTESGAESFPDGGGLADLPGPLKELPGGGDGFVVKLAVGDSIPTPDPDPTMTPGGSHKIHMPVALKNSNLGGSEADFMASADINLVAVSPLGALAQPGASERSFDDFCDFVVGWSWEEDDNFDIRLNIDELGVCSYIMRRLTTGAYGSSSFGQSAPEDFLLETIVRMEGEDGAAGLMFGASESLDAAYVFAVFDSGQYALVHFGDEVVSLGSGTTELNASEPIAIAVRAQGETLTLFVNGEQIGEVADAGPHAGRVGTYVEASGGALPFTNHFEYIRFSDVTAP